MRKIIGLVALLAMIGAFAVSVSGAGAEEVASPVEEAAPNGEAVALAECSSGRICVFTGIDFTGTPGYTECGAEGAHPLGGTKQSGENHCGDRAVWFRVNGNAQYCRNANGQLEVGSFNELWVGAPGSHC